MALQQDSKDAAGLHAALLQAHTAAGEPGALLRVHAARRWWRASAGEALDGGSGPLVAQILVWCRKGG